MLLIAACVHGCYRLVEHYSEYREGAIHSKGVAIPATLLHTLRPPMLTPGQRQPGQCWPCSLPVAVTGQVRKMLSVIWEPCITDMRGTIACKLGSAWPGLLAALDRRQSAWQLLPSAAQGYAAEQVPVLQTHWMG